MYFLARTAAQDNSAIGEVTIFIVAAIVIGVLFALWGSAIARGKRRSSQGWGFACFLTGVIGIVVLLTLPRVER